MSVEIYGLDNIAYLDRSNEFSEIQYQKKKLSSNQNDDSLATTEWVTENFYRTDTPIVTTNRIVSKKDSGNLYLISPEFDISSTPDPEQKAQICFCDKNEVPVGYIQLIHRFQNVNNTGNKYVNFQLIVSDLSQDPPYSNWDSVIGLIYPDTNDRDTFYVYTQTPKGINDNEIATIGWVKDYLASKGIT